MYNPSIWDSELDFGRQQYIEMILRNQSEPMKLRELARMISIIAREPEHADKIDNIKVFHDSRYRRILTADIQEINYSTLYPIVIVHSSEGVKIGSRKDADAFAEAQFLEGVKKIALAQRMARKLSLDGQLTISQDTINAYESEENNV